MVVAVAMVREDYDYDASKCNYIHIYICTYTNWSLEKFTPCTSFHFVLHGTTVLVPAPVARQPIPVTVARRMVSLYIETIAAPGHHKLFESCSVPAGDDSSAFDVTYLHVSSDNTFCIYAKKIR